MRSRWPAPSTRSCRRCASGESPSASSRPRGLVRPQPHDRLLWRQWNERGPLPVHVDPSPRYLLRWMRDGDLRSLAYAGVALGFSYLTRNEAAGGALAGAVAVGAVSYWRAGGRQPSRVRTGASDFAIFSVPPFVAAAGWAVTSYVITGSFFGQISSIYGNKAQESYLQHKTLHGRVLFEIQAIDALAPLLVILLLASSWSQEAGSPDVGSPHGARRSAGVRHAGVSGQYHRELLPVLDRCRTARSPARRRPPRGRAGPNSRRDDSPNPITAGAAPLGAPGRCHPRARSHDPGQRDHGGGHVQPEHRH